MSEALRRSGIDPSQTRNAFDDLRALNNQYGALATDVALAAGGALPPPAGTVADLASLGRSVWNLDLTGALFDVVGFVPVLGDAVKGGRIANRLNDVRRALDVAGAALGRRLQATKEVAGRYWDDIVTANRGAYDAAIRNCTTQLCRENAATIKGPQYGNVPRGDRGNGTWSGERGDGLWRPANGGPPITYRNGFPDYSGHSIGNVDIPMTGTQADFSLADEAFRRQIGDPNWRRPTRTHTWHHNENGVTMQLVPRSVHATRDGASTPHMGGASLWGGTQAEGF